MRPAQILVCLTAFSQSISATAVSGDGNLALDTPSQQPESRNPELSASEDLWKRKGGGGGGGRGGGSSGGSSGSSGSSGGRGGSSGSSGSSSGGKGGSGSNTGGSTTTGSGVRPGYGGGTYYGGGAKQPYKSGSPSPSGIVPFVVAGAALGYIGFVGASFAYGAYIYPYTHPYYFHNRTTNTNETKPVTCLCDYYEECGCDDNGNQTYFNEIIGDGSYANLNKSIVTVADNDTTNETTIYLLGTLPNGTTSSGGTDNPNEASGMLEVARAVGWWPLITTVAVLAFLA
ncbi:hypothetical protein F5B20DRAFT_273217 [Whalleya microplaca]|nr:hypothetical protein F5B20DRAFT_273217 [Whalleya microplaca]